MNKRHADLNAYEFVILGLSLYSLAALAVEAVVQLDPDTRQVLGWVDTAICAVFLFDFVFNLVKAENRWRYVVTWGWIDLVSSVPTINVLGWVGFLRLGRIARVFRILRVLRERPGYEGDRVNDPRSPGRERGSRGVPRVSAGDRLGGDRDHAHRTTAGWQHQRAR